MNFLIPDKMTDNEIIKALGSYEADIGCAKCGFKDKYLLTVIDKALDLINRQKAEIERYKNAYDQIKWERDMFEEDLQTAKAEIERLQEQITAMNCYRTYEAEAIKEFAEDVCGEIDDAIHSNYNAKEEREAKYKKLGIPVNLEDSLLMYCDGKIHALSGIENYISNLVKEKVGDNE